MQPQSKHNLKSTCTPALAWRGFCDWYLEKTRNGPLLTPTPERKEAVNKKATLLISSVLTLALLLLGVAALTSLFAPATVRLLGEAGPATVIYGTLTASALMAAVLFIGIPAVALFRLVRFTRYCCQRGFELEARVRAPASSSKI